MLKIVESREKRRVEKPRLPRKAKKVEPERMKSEMASLGVDIDPKIEGSHAARSRSKSIAKRATMKRKYGEDSLVASKKRERSQSSARGALTRTRSSTGIRDDVMAKKVRKMSKVAQRGFQMEARKGEADRRILDDKPKHLFSGKRKNGTHDRR